jgi:hypothetical protein
MAITLDNPVKRKLAEGGCALGLAVHLVRSAEIAAATTTPRPRPPPSARARNS